MKTPTLTDVKAASEITLRLRLRLRLVELPVVKVRLHSSPQLYKPGPGDRRKNTDDSHVSASQCQWMVMLYIQSALHWHCTV